MRSIRADLHLHTCLSPCGGFDVTPAAVVAKAAELGLELIAVCDHNSAENVAAARQAAAKLDGRGVHVLAGMEITSAEEAHMVALFENIEAALTMQAMVFDHLQEGVNNPDLFGMQIVANCNDEVEYFNERLLIGATDLGVGDVVRRVHGLGGLVIAAHIDRPAFSLVGQLGIIPPGLELDAVEISRINDPSGADQWLAGASYPVITSSDAHHLADIGMVWTEIVAESPCLDELALALSASGDRLVKGWGRRPESLS